MLIKKRVSSLKKNKSYISNEYGNDILKRSQKNFVATSNIKDLKKTDIIANMCSNTDQ